jgi:hypothetical protein
MFLPANEGGDFTPPPSGTHLAICTRVIDLGTQRGEWKGQTKHQRKVLISWELPDELQSEGRPFLISQRYTFSSSEKSRLRQDLEGWRGKRFTDADFGPGGFDIKNVLGKACLLTLVHVDKDGKTYANIASVSALPKGMPLKETATTPIYFSLERDRFDRRAMEELSEGLQDIIAGSPEYRALLEPAANSAGYEQVSGHLDDEIPF